jgi:hypothetical protein
MGSKKKGGSNRKHGRNERACQAYTAGNMQEKNAKRRVRRHLLSHPNDKQAIAVYERAWGLASDIRVVMNKQSTNESMTARARRKAARKADTGLVIHLRAQRDARRHSRRVMAEKLAEQAKHQKPVEVTQV